MMQQNYAIRAMTRAEVETSVNWAAAEGWNPGKHDAESFFAADNTGFLVGELNGEAISTISAVKYGATFGFIGFYIVKPEYRGHGYGIQIWNAALKSLAGRNIGLDGVVAQQDNYKKSGFKLAYRNIRYEGLTSAQSPKSDSQIVDLAQVSFPQVEKYDRQFFPEERSSFLKAWITQKQSLALAKVDGQNLRGYGVIRPCVKGYKIGPLFADTPEIAESLFLSLQAKVPQGSSFYLDTPEPNKEAVALAKKHNMKLVFETARMYTGDFPELPLAKLFGVTTFELG